MAIRLTRPSDPTIERYRSDRVGDDPTFDRTDGAPSDQPPPGFHLTRVAIDLGTDPGIVGEARAAFASWQMHRLAGVEPTPAAPPRTGDTVAIVTRQAGLWILAACRITSTVDRPTACGFTYATLPDHPERGEERFSVTTDPNGLVRFEITATWRSDALIARVGRPLTTAIQRRATGRYLHAMVRSCPRAEQTYPSDATSARNGSRT